MPATRPPLLVLPDPTGTLPALTPDQASALVEQGLAKDWIGAVVCLITVDLLLKHWPKNTKHLWLSTVPANGPPGRERLDVILVGTSRTPPFVAPAIDVRKALPRNVGQWLKHSGGLFLSELVDCPVIQPLSSRETIFPDDLVGLRDRACSSRLAAQLRQWAIEEKLAIPPPAPRAVRF